MGDQLREAELYSIVESYLNLEFATRLKPKHGTHLPLVCNTATAGPAGSGIWSRPDLSLINFWRHKYQPVGTLDLYGFEVKRDGNCDLKAVYETLAHTRLVHFAYLVWHYRAEDFEAKDFKTILDSCAAYQLGLVTFSDHEDGATFKLHREASRASPSAHNVDDFIETRFPEKLKSQLLGWIDKRR